MAFSVVVHQCFGQQCGYTSVHVRAEERNQQIFTVKAVNPIEQGESQIVIAGDSNFHGPLYAHAKAIEYIDVENQMPQNVVFGDVLKECGMCNPCT